MLALMRFTLKPFMGVLLMSLLGCNHLLYPGDRHPYVKASQLHPKPQDLFIPLNKGVDSPYLHAWLFRAQSPSKGMVVHFHGNGQNLTTHFFFFQWLVAEGYDYLVFDYRGYGSSSEGPATQEKTIVDGHAVLNYISQQFPDKPLLAIGQSLGSNVLMRVLQERHERSWSLPKAVILDSAFLSYQQAGSSVLGQRWFLYPLKPFAYLLLDDTHSALNKIKSTPRLPALFFHGSQDPIINLDLGRAAFEHWPGSKKFLLQEQGGHTAAFGDERFISSRQQLLDFLQQTLSKSLTTGNAPLE